MTTVRSLVASEPDAGIMMMPLSVSCSLSQSASGHFALRGFESSESGAGPARGPAGVGPRLSQGGAWDSDLSLLGATTVLLLLLAPVACNFKVTCLFASASHGVYRPVAAASEPAGIIYQAPVRRLLTSTVVRPGPGTSKFGR